MLFVLRADNQGEVGIMALTALARRAAGERRKLRSFLVVCGLCGAALFYGDSMITPALLAQVAAGYPVMVRFSDGMLWSEPRYAMLAAALVVG